jgi:hypothetical protein
MKRKTENCMFCGSALEYLNKAEELVCTYCQKRSTGHVKCREGHFVCEDCHNQEALRMIEAVVRTTTEKDPIRIAELMMSHPTLPMLGCEHAFIAAGSLLAALRNSPYAKITELDIKEVFDRTAKQAVGGYCGLTGVCGIVPALGACFSVFLGARCGSDSEQKYVMEAVIRTARVVADLTGPSCCKAYVRASLAAAVDLFAERFGVVLPLSKTKAVCRHADKHPHGCREEKCPYFVKVSKDIFAESIHLPVTVCQS